uniref:CBM21 domain-containing protein n=1 Tax=Glossina palpalis gambiensis TaxID=67801 RepID=A0A1B0C5W9_9MUSC
MISHSPPIFSHSPPINYLADYMNQRQSINCNDEHNRASRYCRPQVITLASKTMVKKAQQRATSPVFKKTKNSSTDIMDINRPRELDHTNGTLRNTIQIAPKTPKSCLRRKSCLQETASRAASFGIQQITDKDTDTNISSQTIASTTSDTVQHSCPRKKVIFADDEGLALTQVRVMSEPSNVPPYWSMKFLEQITQGLVTPHPADQWTVDFKQPASDYLAFRQTIERNFVSLENVIVKDEESLVVGTVKVKNIAYEKEVMVRVTWDDWKSQQDIFCAYNKAYGPASCAHVIFDTFSFKITLPPSSKRLEFCICFRSGNQECWDNNQNKNYTITKRSPFYCNSTLTSYSKSALTLQNTHQRSTLSEALTKRENQSKNERKNLWHHHEHSPYW